MASTKDINALCCNQSRVAATAEREEKEGKERESCFLVRPQGGLLSLRVDRKETGEERCRKTKAGERYKFQYGVTCNSNNSVTQVSVLPVTGFLKLLVHTCKLAFSAVP